MQNTIKQRFDLQYMAHNISTTYRCKKEVTRELKGSSHTLAILMSKLRSSLGAAWEQPGSSLEYAYSEITAHSQRDYSSLSTRLRLVGHDITARRVNAPASHSRKWECVGTDNV